MQIRIYFNLHKRLFTIQTKRPNGWRVSHHAEAVTISLPRFKVSEAGRQRVLRQKRKNVHAFIEGELSTLDWSAFAEDMEGISYNPYKAGTFVNRENGQPVFSARVAVARLDERGIPTLSAL